MRGIEPLSSMCKIDVFTMKLNSLFPQKSPLISRLRGTRKREIVEVVMGKTFSVDQLHLLGMMLLGYRIHKLG